MATKSSKRMTNDLRDDRVPKTPVVFVEFGLVYFVHVCTYQPSKDPSSKRYELIRDAGFRSLDDIMHM